MSFQDPARLPSSPRKGFIDILIHCGKKRPVFLIEAKRDGTNITAQHRQQALDYGRSKDIAVLLVAVTNGRNFELLNTTTGQHLALNDKTCDLIPSKTDLLTRVIPALKKDHTCLTITIDTDRSLPFRPGLPLSKLNRLFKQCHNTIRRIEKNEESAFADFSKFLFLKLLEEKWDTEMTDPPYTFFFHELAAKPPSQADQVATAIRSMIDTIKTSTPYGDVLADPLRLTKPATYLKIVQRLSEVSFTDCHFDSKGAAFEYFVRATLKGKKLGQYFTPRPLVRLMLTLGRWQQINSQLLSGRPFKVLDPACGTGGFLVTAMQTCIDDIRARADKHDIHPELAHEAIRQLKADVFYGIDANDGVACSAKMNMIVAGDGHNNIRCTDSLAQIKLVPDYRGPDNVQHDDGLAHLILTNPPFGTSESESLDDASLREYEVTSTKGQSLFLQKMIASIHDDSRIVTVIDEGVLNTASDFKLRQHILKTCRLEYVLRLPEQTFKPNKINVRASVLVMTKRTNSDNNENLSDSYSVAFIDILSLGYEGSGEDIRGFNLSLLLSEVASIRPDALPEGNVTTGYNWSAFRVHTKDIYADATNRLDVKYWRPQVRKLLSDLAKREGSVTIRQLNQVPTRRGESPPAAEYVDQADGYAMVVKPGSSISKQGELNVEDADYIEKALFDEYDVKGLALKDGDILLSSTGDGTLGKCCVYRLKANNKTVPAIADGHVTVIRPDRNILYPEYLADYLRKGFGSQQLNRIFTGSTGMVEITPSDVDKVIVPPLPSLSQQKLISRRLRKAEMRALSILQEADRQLSDAETDFKCSTLRVQ
jgi:type I restriction enzyme M protein